MAPSLPDHDARTGRRWLRPRVLVPILALGAGLLGVGLVLFEPWTLLVDNRVEEAAPVAPGRPSAPATDVPKATGSVRAKATPAAPGPAVLLKGRFVAHEHATSGRVEVLELEDGSRVLRIKGLDTSNGPDLRVWLSDAPVRKGRAGWFVFDDGRHRDLGALKGNLGNQNYAVPPGTDLESLRSLSIWCARFRVSFGAAALA